MRRALSAAARAGLALAVLDLVFAWTRHDAPRMSWVERGRFVVAVVGAISASLVALTAVWMVGVRASRRLPDGARGALCALVGASTGALAGVALFSGTGVRRMGLRPWGIALSVLAATALAVGAWRRREGLRALAAWRGLPWALSVFALGTYALHATVLTRQYELVHGLAALGCGVALTSAVALRWPVRAGGVALMALALGVTASWMTARSNALRSTLRQMAPVARFPVMLVGAALRGRGDASAVGSERTIAGPRLPLHGLDLVLVTIDALRADRLTAMGGRGRMPVLDAMARRGVLFRRAYCATPHTSYSLASLMMGTYARSVLALPGPARAHGTLAGWLGAAGYATAGFFPPAVFAVDGERFGALREGRFGFATRVEGYADAPARVREVERWLDTRRAGERVFAWVHLFEPHEPYVTHPEHAYGEGAEARYDAECSAADDAIGALRAAFERRGRRAAWVVTADHGEEFGEHGGSFHGTTLYDEQLRVPMVLEVPGVAPGVVDEAVSLVDVAPTLLAGAGLSRPPRVRGNNLGALVMHTASDTRAFAATGSLRMVATARDKLIVDLSDGTLERYVFATDPRERRNLADEDPGRARALRDEIAVWEASHARVESQRVEGERTEEVTLPDVLNRAIQGDVSVAGDVAGLLGAGGYPVRRRAAHVLGELGVRDSVVLDALARELESRDAALADEAGVSLALLGDPRGRELARAVLGAHRGQPTREEALRAAVALARLGDHAAVPVLSAWVNHATGSDAHRDEAVAALRGLGDVAAMSSWVTLLTDMRLAPRAAEALGALGDARAIDPLRTSLPTQRYPLTIRAIAGALATLRAPDVAERVREALVMSDPLPDVWALLASLEEPGRRVRGSARAVTVTTRPGVIALRGGALSDRAQGARRLYLHTRAEQDARLTVLPGVELAVPAGERELSIDLQAPWRGTTLRVTATATVTVLGVAAR